MKLKVSLRQPTGIVDLAITADATASVGDVAAYLAAADPRGGGPAGGSVTLRTTTVASAAPRMIDATTESWKPAIESGSYVELVQSYPGQADRRVRRRRSSASSAGRTSARSSPFRPVQARSAESTGWTFVYPIR